MPVFRVITEKYSPGFGEYWSNVYHMNGSNMADLAAHVTNLVNAEKLLYYGSTLITKSRIDDEAPNTDNFITVIRNMNGTRAVPAAPGDASMPLFVTARVDFGVAAGGRPCRKYLRSCLAEADCLGTVLAPAMISLLGGYVATCLTLPLCDPAGNLINSGAAMNVLQMRQLRRGKKRKVTPSLPGQV